MLPLRFTGLSLKALPAILLAAFCAPVLAQSTRVAEWRSVARPTGNVAQPSFLNALQVAPEQLDSFLRVMSRTDLTPSPDLSETQIRDAVASYTAGLEERVQSSAGQPALVPATAARSRSVQVTRSAPRVVPMPDTPASARLREELRDLPILLQLVPQQAGPVWSTAARLEWPQRAPILDRIEQAAALWQHREGGDFETEVAVALPRGYEALDVQHQRFVDQVLVPGLGRRVVYHRPNVPRDVVVDKDMLLWRFRGESNLIAQWTPHVEAPEVHVSETDRVLMLPQQGGRLYSLSVAVRHWLMGHSLHPHISKKKVVKQRVALGDPDFIPRRVQHEGIEAGVRSMDRGDRQFLYVSPTSTGKSYVVGALVRHRIRQRKSKLHIITAEQNLLVGQLSQDLKNLKREGARIIHWGDEDRASLDKLREALKTATPEHPILLVSTSQSLRAHFYDRIENDEGEAVTFKIRPEVLSDVAPNLGTIVFDEAQHTGAATYMKMLNDLMAASNACLLGATATPMHASKNILSVVFGNHAFWSYIDTPEGYLEHVGTYQRDLDTVIDQLNLAIQNGDVPPLDNFYAIRTDKLAPAGDFFNRPNGDQLGDEDYFNHRGINPAYYSALIKRLQPLFLKHSHGLIVVDNIHEAESLTALLNQAIPTRRFVMLHTYLGKREKRKIVADVKAGRTNYLVALRMLDEGLNFDDFTLYVDGNEGVGPGRFLQRFGRIERMNPGKEGVDVAVLMDMNETTLRENLIFFTRLLEGGFSTRSRRHARRVIHLPDMETLDEIASPEQLRALQEDLRKLFVETQANPPLARSIRYVEETGKLPTAKEDMGAYIHCLKLAWQEESEWPAGLSEQFKALLRAKGTVLRKQKAERDTAGHPLARNNRFVRKKDKLPSEKEDIGAHAYWRRRVRLPESEWPSGMSDRFRELLSEQAKTIKKKARKRKKSGSPLSRNNEFVENHGRLPTAEEDHGAYIFWLRRYMLQESEWPAGMSPVFILALRAKAQVLGEQAAQRAAAGTPLSRSNALVAKLHELPGRDQDIGVHSFWIRLLRKPEKKWPAGMSHEFRKLLRARLVETPLVRSNYIVEETRSLPAKKEDRKSYEYTLSLARIPESEWPADMSPRFRQLLRDKIKSRGE